MRAVIEAIFAEIEADATIAARLTYTQGLVSRLQLYRGRLPLDALTTADAVAVLVTSSTTVGNDSKETMTVQMDVISQNAALIDDVYDDLRRLFHETSGTRWRKLEVPDWNVSIRLTSAQDLPEPGTELARKSVLFTVRAVPPAA